MNIKIEKSGNHYRADCLDFPGSPPVGLGKTKNMALMHLFWQAMFTDVHGVPCEATHGNNWVSRIKRSDPIMVNGKPWELPSSYRREQ